MSDNFDLLLQDKQIEELSLQIEEKDKTINELLDIISEKDETIKILKDKIIKNNEKNKQEKNDKEEYYYFYIISNCHDSRFKIGITKNLKSRMSSIQTGNHENIKIINFLMGNKNTILELEKILKEKMNQYNVHGEWFELSNKDKLDFFDFINKLKLKDKTINDLSSFIQNNKKMKLSEINILDLIEILKNNDFYKKDNKLVYFIKNTNQIITDYDYFFDTTNIIENDLSQTKFNKLFKRLNQDHFLNMFDTFIYNTNDFNNESVNQYFNQFSKKANSLIGISLEELYKNYVIFCENNKIKSINKKDFLMILQNHHFNFFIKEVKTIFNETIKVNVFFNEFEIDLSNQIISYLIKDLGNNFNQQSIFWNEHEKVNVDFLLSKENELDYFFS